MVEATTRFSDNAAADYLLDRVGEELISSFVRRMGLETQDPILPAIGEFRAWHRSPGSWLEMNPAERAREAWRLARGPRMTPDEVDVDEAIIRRCAEIGCRGTAGEWCELMARIAAGRNLPAVARDLLWEALEPRDGAAGDAGGRCGHKAGDLPGVLAYAGYVRDRAGVSDIALALFSRNLCADDQIALAETIPRKPAELLDLAEALVP